MKLRSPIDPWRRRDIFRKIRREMLDQNPRQDLRGFVTGIALPLITRTEASALGVMMRFQESTRHIFFLVRADGEVCREVRPLVEDESLDTLEPREGTSFQDPAFAAMAERVGVAPTRVRTVPVVTRSGHIATLELADPNLALVPDAASLRSDLREVWAVFELAFLNARLRRERLEARLLQSAAKQLGRTLDLPSILDAVLDLLGQVVPYDAAAVFILGGDKLDVVHQSVRGYDAGEKEKLKVKLGEGIVGWVAEEGRPQIVPEVDRDARYVAARRRTRSEMVVPLRSAGRVIGVFNLENDDAVAYTPHDMDLLISFAGQAAAAVERTALLEERESARRLEQELEIARRIQRFFLPRSDRALEERGIAAETISSLEVSGDYYDLVRREDGSVLMVVADVSGKGIPAALIMSSLRAAFHLASAREDDPGEWCVRFNDLLIESLRDTEFVTGVFGVLSGDQRRFTYCNAGHNPPMLLRADGRMDRLETGGTILGAFPEQRYEVGTVELGPGDRLVLFTDGVTEAFDPGERQLGEDGLDAILRRGRKESAASLVSTIVASVRAFVQGPLPDDLTVVVVDGPAER